MGRMFTFISAGLRISAVAFVIAFAMRFPFSSVRPKLSSGETSLVVRVGPAAGSLVGRATGPEGPPAACDGRLGNRKVPRRPYSQVSTSRPRSLASATALSYTSPYTSGTWLPTWSEHS